MTIRGRLTLLYTASLAGLLVLLFTGLLWTQPRVGLAMLDTDLRHDAVTIDGVLQNELAEGLDPQAAVREMLAELKLPGRGLAVYDAKGTLLGARWEQLEPTGSGGPSDNPRTVPTASGLARIHRGMVGPGGEWSTVVAASLSPVARDTAVLRKTLFIALPFALLAAAVAGWLVLTRALQPLESMAMEAQQITASETGRRLSAGGSRDELGNLAIAFNDLLDRLSTALDRQREFMADASHELRTPASIARIAAEVTLSSDARTIGEYRDALRIVHEQTRRMSRLIDDMLLLARADSGRRAIEPTDFYLDEVIDECVRSLRILAAPRGVSIAAAGRPGLQVRGDEALIRQLVINLVDNAVRHSPAGASVRVDATTDDTRAIIQVADEGPGVPGEDRTRIFERFVKLDPARMHRGGAGLGLPIARWIAEAHGGSLVLAEHDGRGSRFVATVRLTPSQERAQAL